jgi:hypothetical protein
MRDIMRAVLEEQNLETKLDKLSEKMEKVIFALRTPINTHFANNFVGISKTGSFFIYCNQALFMFFVKRAKILLYNLFELQLDEAQGVKINELKQQMMNISGQIEKVGRVYFSVLDVKYGDSVNCTVLKLQV